MTGPTTVYSGQEWIHIANMAFMECTDEMYAHYGDLVDAKEKEFADFPDQLRAKMQTSVTREEVARQRAALAC